LGLLLRGTPFPPLFPCPWKKGLWLYYYDDDVVPVAFVEHSYKGRKKRRGISANGDSRHWQCTMADYWREKIKGKSGRS